jgi:hypothetical protein
MSSKYRILCLSHDPATQIKGDFTAHEAAVTAARDPRLYGEQLALHVGCDLLVAEYSYPLVEVCCPGHQGLGEDGHDDHIEPRWIRTEWLHVIAASYRLKPTDGLTVTIGGPESGCWTEQRIHRLRSELNP